MHRFRFCALAIILVIAATVAGFEYPAAAGSADPVNVSVLFFNDIHGHLSPFKIRTDSGKKEVGGVARLATLRCRITRIPYGDQGIFTRGDYFRRIGGYRDLPLMEDVELMRRVKHRGDKICILSDHVMTSARRWEEEGFLFGLLRNTILFTLFILRVSPKKLARFYKSEYKE